MIWSCIWTVDLRAELIAKNAVFSYNTLMRTSLVTTAVLCLLLTAVPAWAQEEDIGDAPTVSIEEMLLQQALNGERHIDGRMSRRILELQEKEALAKLAAAEAALLAAQNPPEEEEVLYSAAPDEEGTPVISADDGITVTSGGETITLSATSLRLLARLQNRSGYANPALHSGAPLAPTGPGTILAVFVMALAVGFTYLRAWMLEKKNRE